MTIQDGLFCAGFGSLVWGVAQVYAPAGWIVGGGLVVVLCVLSRLKG